MEVVGLCQKCSVLANRPTGSPLPNLMFALASMLSGSGLRFRLNQSLKISSISSLVNTEGNDVRPLTSAIKLTAFEKPSSIVLIASSHLLSSIPNWACRIFSKSSFISLRCPLNFRICFSSTVYTTTRQFRLSSL